MTKAGFFIYWFHYGGTMKRDFAKSEYEEIKKQLDALHKADKEQAPEILRSMLAYMEDTDLSSHPSEECALLRGIVLFYVNLRDANRAYDYALKAQEVAKKGGNSEDILGAQSLFAIIHSIRGENLKAIDIWEDILVQIDSCSLHYLPILNNLVVAYGFSHQFAKSIDLGYKLLQNLEESNAPATSFCSAYINLGNSYTAMNKHEQAINAFEKALELAEQIGHFSYMNSIHGNLVGIYTDMGDLEKAYHHSLQEYAASQKLPGNIQIAEALSRMGDVCLKLKRLDESEEYLLKALEMLRKEPNPVSISDCLMSLGRLYLEKDEPDKAIASLEEAGPMVASTNVELLYRTLYMTLNSYYLYIKDYEKAHDCLDKLVALNQKEFKDLSENMISVVEAEYLRHQIEKKNEAYQAQNEELTRSMDMLNRLISVLSHDVRGPVANSAQALRLILEGSVSAASIQELTSHVIDNLEASSDLLAEMMLWIESRAFSKEVKRLLQDVDVLCLLESVIQYYRGQIRQKELELVLDFTEETLFSYSEPNILKIAMRNILSNAIKYSHKGGKIYISLSAETDSILLRIRDEGIGMRPEELDKLMIKELKPTMGTAQELGMGMGLRLSFSYLQLLGIRYDIQSKEQAGTKFTLYLPIAQPKEDS